MGNGIKTGGFKFSWGFHTTSSASVVVLFFPWSCVGGGQGCGEKGECAKGAYHNPPSPPPPNIVPGRSSLRGQTEVCRKLVSANRTLRFALRGCRDTRWNDRLLPGAICIICAPSSGARSATRIAPTCDKARNHWGCMWIHGQTEPTGRLSVLIHAHVPHLRTPDINNALEGTPRQNALEGTPRQNALEGTPRQNALEGTPRQNALEARGSRWKARPTSASHPRARTARRVGADARRERFDVVWIPIVLKSERLFCPGVGQAYRAVEERFSQLSGI
eukprot:gene25711-biopygen15056